MTVHVGLLRAVNLGGVNRVAMADLRDLLEGLGAQDGKTLLQSGNVLFRGDGRTPAEWERLLESATADRLGVRTDFFVRTAAEWKRIIAANPFPGEAKRDPGHLLVVLLKSSPVAASVAALQSAITGREVVRAAGGRHVYAFYPDGVGRSRLSAALMERELGTRGTARNWNTVLKIGALAGSFP